MLVGAELLNVWIGDVVGCHVCTKTVNCSIVTGQVSGRRLLPSQSVLATALKRRVD